MKSIFLFLFIISLSIPGYTKSNSIGVGVILVEPTGLSANYNLRSNRSIDAAMGFPSGGLHLHSTYLFHNLKPWTIDHTKVDWYVGIGGRILTNATVNDNKKTLIGPRGSVGARYFFIPDQLETFGELALIVNIIESSSADLDLGIGIRYYF
ncbi:MAG: hypothetical protein KDD50_05620 [Bdellovibrionales bacterium]|nr:hypothetical protein [Bdellovibrionales bacterium]